MKKKNEPKKTVVNKKEKNNTFNILIFFLVLIISIIIFSYITSTDNNIKRKNTSSSNQNQEKKVEKSQTPIQNQKPKLEWSNDYHIDFEFWENMYNDWIFSYIKYDSFEKNSQVVFNESSVIVRNYDDEISQSSFRILQWDKDQGIQGMMEVNTFFKIHLSL